VRKVNVGTQETRPEVVADFHGYGTDPGEAVDHGFLEELADIWRLNSESELRCRAVGLSSDKCPCAAQSVGVQLSNFRECYRC
jgi:hypothetical protein